MSFLNGHKLQYAEINCGEIVEPIINQLLDTGVLLKDISYIDYDPPNLFDLAVILKHKVSNSIKEGLSFLSYIDKTEILNNYLNIKFNYDIAQMYKPKTQSNNKCVAVEHTSLNPVYPINLSTYRISTIGEWYRKVFDFLGYNTQARFWVHENSRHVSVVAKAFTQNIFTTNRSSIGKGDHTVGRIFSEEINTNIGVKRNVARNKSINLFPCGRSSTRRPKYCDWIKDVINGWEKTFNSSGIKIDTYDRNKDILNVINSEKIKSVLNTDLITQSRILNYKNLSIIYYIYLLQISNKSYSIVNNRQNTALRQARDRACLIENRDVKDLSIIPVSDVLSDNEYDNIKKWKFISIDLIESQYGLKIENLQKYFLMSNNNSVIHLENILKYNGKDKIRLKKREGIDIIQAVLLLDQLPMILNRSITHGNFSQLILWLNDAKYIKRKIRNNFYYTELNSIINFFCPSAILENKYA